jgi:hypothetical protein
MYNDLPPPRLPPNCPHDEVVVDLRDPPDNPFPFRIGTICRAALAYENNVTPDFLVEVVDYKIRPSDSAILPVCMTIRGGRSIERSYAWTNVGGPGTTAAFGRDRLVVVRGDSAFLSALATDQIISRELI